MKKMFSETCDDMIAMKGGQTSDIEKQTEDKHWSGMFQQKYKRGKTNETGEGENKRRNEGERKRGRKNSKKSEGKKGDTSSNGGQVVTH